MKNNKAITLIAAVLLGTGLIAAQAAEKKAEPKKQTTCPVMGGKINKAQYADVQGKRIYVCCPGCIGKIKADPDKYIKQLEAEGIVLDKAPMKTDGKKQEAGHEGHQH
jgi:YHS domain-containing protein